MITLLFLVVASCSSISDNEVIIAYTGEDFSVTTHCDNGTKVDLKAVSNITMCYYIISGDECIIPVRSLTKLIHTE